MTAKRAARQSRRSRTKRTKILRRGDIVNKVMRGDCMDIMARIADDSVDMVLADLPYGTTRNKWDSVLPLEALWEQYRRIAKPNAAIVLTAAQPFTSTLVCSNIEEFRVEWIWEKTIGSGQLNINHQPLRIHESVLVFYRELPVYHPQMTTGEPYSLLRKAGREANYNAQRDIEVVNKGVRWPKTVITVANPRVRGGHPTQKPVALFEYFIKTYSNPGDLIMDNTFGAGTTAVAALRAGRKYTGIEIDSRYVAMAKRNIRAVEKEMAAGR
jgi:site-specific DNA-methyltransferase (adenine-specific)